MELYEFKKAKKKNYHWLIRHLKSKYGKIPKSEYYFKTDGYKQLTHNKNDNLYKKGLFIHHIEEIIFPDLSNPYGKYSSDKKLQRGDHLLYCDYLEHALLHTKIIEYKEFKLKKYYVGGLLGYLVPELNSFYSHGIHAYNNGANMKLRPFYDRIVKNYETYIQLMAYIVYIFADNNLINNVDVMNKATGRLITYNDFFINTTSGVREDILKIMKSKYHFR